MTLPVPHPTLKESFASTSTASIGGTPLASYASVPFRGRVSKITALDQGVITSADCAVAVAVNGTNNTSLAFTIPVTGAAAGRLTTFTPGSLVYLNEDDVLTFTPSGASGSSIGCHFRAYIQAG